MPEILVCPSCGEWQDPSTYRPDAVAMCLACKVPLQREMQEAVPAEWLSDPPSRLASGSPEIQKVVLAGLDIPFADLVWILVKVALAAIPAVVILVLLGSLLIFVLGAFGALL
jgi:hypothetical protein